MPFMISDDGPFAAELCQRTEHGTRTPNETLQVCKQVCKMYNSVGWASSQSCLSLRPYLLFGGKSVGTDKQTRAGVLSSSHYIIFVI